MSPPRKKRKPKAEPAPLTKLIRFLRGPGRPLVSLGVLAAAITVAWYLAWPVVRDRVLASESYLVSPQQVHITEPPEWIHADVRSEVFQNTGLDGRLSILDDDVAERLSNAFSLHPWVAKVGRVSKHHPARLDVELFYRRPVCMVEVSGRLYPVDVQGVLLPGGDFSAVEAARYPRLSGVDVLPVGTVGESWGDGRVLGGAEIAHALLSVWQQWKLLRIEPSAGSNSSAVLPGRGIRHTYHLVTRGGTRVFWGRAPGTDASGGLPTAEKIARLKQYLAERGTLEGRGGPQELDVHLLKGHHLELPRISSRPKR